MQTVFIYFVLKNKNKSFFFIYNTTFFYNIGIYLIKIV